MEYFKNIFIEIQLHLFLFELEAKIRKRETNTIKVKPENDMNISNRSAVKECFSFSSCLITIFSKL